MSLSAHITKPNRKLLVTFLGAGIGALVADHLLKPGLKRRLKV